MFVLFCCFSILVQLRIFGIMRFMNKNYKVVCDYFITKCAISEDKAISIDGLNIQGVKHEDLVRMLKLIGDFHEASDGKYWYSRTPLIKKEEIVQSLIKTTLSILLTVMAVVVINLIFRR